ncbi:SigE family RNA polymerase sigma factor [Nocardioides speluncae]|uniref:SigE family RNA polymerase sigma factor n=1 Tax=Nocardioides speluncae TaxID=2670337 RepID=UPI000D685F57|nr:SigE family RNA polymerase sigma factor [Nocardioides speluncae]
MKRADRDAAFTAYVMARETQFRRLAFVLCGDWHRAEDLLQTAYTKLYVAWPRIQRAAAEDAYMRRILVRTNIDDSRRFWNRERPTSRHPERPMPSPDLEQAQVVLSALQRLPDMQRKAVTLRHWCDLSIAETAEALGIAEGTVKVHSNRGLNRLRELLSVDEHDHENDKELT